MDENKKTKVEEIANKVKTEVVRLKDATVRTVKDTAHWAVENPKEAALLSGLFIGAKNMFFDKERTYEDKRKTYWDGRKQWYLRREMTTREQLELDRRLERGESAGEILSDMGLLKY